jgi:hypothetical protein
LRVEFGSGHTLAATNVRDSRATKVVALHSQRRGPVITDAERSERALAQTLGWAQEAADRGSIAEAVDWLHYVELIHGTLPAAWQRQRAVWMDPQGSHPALDHESADRQTAAGR